MSPAILSARDGGIATVTLSNPETPNALNAAMWRTSAQAVDHPPHFIGH